MKKNILLSFFLICFTVVCFADEINELKALRIAQDFYAKQSALRVDKKRSLQQSQVSGSEKLEFRLDYVHKESSTKVNFSNLRSATDSGANLYYVFNVGEDNGFVIVSGDDRVSDVLAYSLEGSFSHGDMPVNAKALMEEYSTLISAVVKGDLYPEPNIKQSKKRNTNFPDAVGPLLEKTAWGQRHPYNAQCPLEKGKRTLVGCVATAMSQVMSHHKYPERGRGTIDYSRKGHTFLMDLDTLGNYDWNNILQVYDSSSTQAQNDAVAKLCYHAGLSLYMGYGASSSSTGSGQIPGALIRNFDYDKGLDGIDRREYSRYEWLDIMKKEFFEGRPVTYSGSNHAFLADGYDKNNFIHFNFGWSGRANAFYNLDMISTDGSLGDITNYPSVRHYMVMGIQPNKGTKESPFHLRYKGVNMPRATKKGDDLSVDVTSLNNGKLVDCVFALNLLNGKDTITLAQTTVTTDEEISTLNLKGKASEIISDGEYALKIMHKTPIGSWTDDYYFLETKRNLSARIEGDTIFLRARKLDFDLTRSGELEINDGKSDLIISGDTIKMDLTLENMGEGVFYSKIAVKCFSEANGKWTEVVSDLRTLESGDVQRMFFWRSPILTPGVNQVQVFCTNGNQYGNYGAETPTPVGEPQKIMVYPKNVKFKLAVEKMEYQEKIKEKKKLTLKMTLQNNGYDYIGPVIFDFFSWDGLSATPLLNLPQEVEIKKGEKKSFDFTFDCDTLPLGKYSFRVKHLTKTSPRVLMNANLKHNFHFEVSNEATEQKTPNIYTQTLELFIVKNNKTLEVLLPDKSEAIEIFDLLGRKLAREQVVGLKRLSYNIESLSSACGIYIILVTGEFGQQTKKFYVN